MIPHPIQVFAFKQLQFGMKVAAKILDFRQPELFTGPGSSLQLCDHIVGTGVKKLLLVSDEFLLKIGMLQPM
ncbi:MAG: alcohol dehydrogenase, partial [Nocardiaceae bacterium]|nr:alcohol dehydrogenase [Nocardiaceae bacterium]